MDIFMKRTDFNNGIPISLSLDYLNHQENSKSQSLILKKRLIRISILSIIVAVAISFIAKLLIYLIDLVTNLSFYGIADVDFRSPAQNHLGWWVILIPAIGGLIVGFMALYGSKAIRGHGIPEAMEQILVNDSKIKPIIAFLKPISSAIAIGTGGPFGAEGPIIATGGALGSTLGQLFKITSSERKVILAAGATAGMSAIFGTPIAAIFLAVELLLFEFSPKAILPVALACITGSAGHHFLFESGPVFPMPNLSIPSNFALGIYSFIGIIIGFLSLVLTKAVYYVEDAFEKLPVHWMWWPALGGLGVGLIGYYQPNTLGVGYDNIISVLSGNVTLTLLLSLSLFKFISWAIALGSGTSGGTLAPLLTIGGACGAITGSLIMLVFPSADINLSMAALIGMSAMFAGASRAYLTSIAFALEATMQPAALLPLLGACTASYLISFFFMENTIMTEKIARRGIYTPDAYEPDILRKLSAGQIISKKSLTVAPERLISEIRSLLEERTHLDTHFLVVDSEGDFLGTVAIVDLYGGKVNPEKPISSITKKPDCAVRANESLSKAVELMSELQEEIIPVLSETGQKIIGVLTYRDILKAYKIQIRERKEAGINLSLKRQRMKMMVKGKNLYKATRS
jgi:CIC family chloride channel protein